MTKASKYVVFMVDNTEVEVWRQCLFEVKAKSFVSSRADDIS
jgi:hypothetical protein